MITVRQSEAMMAADPTGRDYSAMHKSLIDFLDLASFEEKGSLGWAQSRAAAETGYLWSMRDEGRTPEDVSTGNYLVELFKSAYSELSASGVVSANIKDMPSWIKASQLWCTESDTSAQLSWTL